MGEEFRKYHVKKEFRDEIPEEIKAYEKIVTEDFKYKWSGEFEVWTLIGIKESDYDGFLECTYKLKNNKHRNKFF